MNKLITIGILLALGGGGGYYYYNSTKKPEIPEFAKVTVSEGEIVEEVSATGTLQAKRTVAVGSQVSGRVTNVYVDFNDIVKKGQVLARIDTALLDTQVQIQQANIDRQEVDIASQEVQLADAKRSLERNRELLEKKLVPQQAYDAAELAVKSRESQIASARKQMVTAKIALDQARINVGYATIPSTIDGVVVDRKVDPGMTVQSSQNVATLFTLAEDLTTLKLEGGVDESEIGKVRQGMTVRFGVDAYPNQTFMGKITMVRLNPTTQSNVVTYTTVAEVSNGDLRLKPGMTAQMRIEVSRRDNVMRIPNAALRFRPNNDMYAALKQDPPTPAGRGGRGANAGAPGAAPGATPAVAAPGATPAATPAAARPTAAPSATAPQAAAAEGRGNRQRGGDAGATNPFQGGGGRGGGDRTAGGGGDRTGGGDRMAGGTGGRGGGRGGGFNSTLTPEQQKQMEAIRQLPREERAAAMAKLGITFGGRGGGGRGGAGQGQGQGQQGQGQGQRQGQGARPGASAGAGAGASLTQRSADSIDQLFPPIVRNPTRGQVYILLPPDPGHKYGTLKRLDIMQGITNGTFTELVTGPPELAVGTELVSNISMPWLAAKAGATNPANPFSGQQPGRGPGGMPGGGGPGGGGRGGGGGGGR
ncbi:MAG TPA: efflux RND transporter periplasmic adaptor subunit [Vicinamibacterales bacterium]|nr:efflux RND transporter periplasmic adaptor subunit [Vicinamibacterales bacterium]